MAEKSGWGKPLPARAGRGVSVQPSFASFIATVVEAEVDDDGEVQLRRVTTAVDTGIAVNPDTIVAQLQGGLIFGLTAALYGEITLDKGRVQQSNFNDYRMLRIDQVPPIDVHLIKSGEAPGGIGETGVTAASPALRNAIYAATGVALAPPPDRPRGARREQGVTVMRWQTRHHRHRRRSCADRRSARWAGKYSTPGRSAFAGGSTVALADYHGADPTGVPRRPQERRPRQRGDYLARAADCAVCHTAPGGQHFAGGLAFRLPFGTLYSTNITADKDTGIGNYSDAEFPRRRAAGLRPDGSHLYPAMPFRPTPL